LDLVRAADVEILPDNFLEKHAAAHRAIQHLSEREFRLQDRQLIAIAGTAICDCEWMWQLA
jgi:hypothetical protein